MEKFRLELNPVVFWSVVGVIVVGLLGFWLMRERAASGPMQTGGSEAAQQKFQQTGKFYQPPAGMPVPGGQPGGMMGGPGGMYRPPMGAPGGQTAPGGMTAPTGRP
jgi:hypothetical protein